RVDIRQVGTRRADEQRAAAPVTQPWVGVEQVGGAVQGDHRLARARSAVDDQGPARIGPDDGVLIGGDGGQHTVHLRGAGTVQGGQDRKSTRLNSSHVSISYAVFC